MRLSEIWRHPVKSLQGESLTAARIESDGLDGDRVWAIRDTATMKVLTARRERRLLFAGARLGSAGEPDFRLPDGREVRGTGPETDAALSSWLGRPVALVRSDQTAPAVGEFFDDPIDESSAVIEWTMPSGRFVDAFPLHVLTTASLRAGAAAFPSGTWDVRRFRPNLVVQVDSEGWVEDQWRGRVLRVGEARLLVTEACARCTMVTRAQPGLDSDVDVYRTVARHHAATFGVWASVETPGLINIGDSLDIV
ncbi:MAG TPA: MOSC N-terminal beta barrel domain-containing protein [Acidimicrobiales bacterium]|nr:MOSC N-terminal beta barrel domain-containing protein [Acidimicrobiales bacterium]